MKNWKNTKLWSHNFLNDFKHWVEESEKTGEILIGANVIAKGSLKEIQENVDCPFHPEEQKNIAKCFWKNGGVIKEVLDDLFLIKTKKGKFFIKKEFTQEA